MSVILAAGLMTGCSAQWGLTVKTDGEEPAPDGRPRIRVVTTIFPPADFVRQIGGDYVEVSQLLKAGMEAHSYEPTPRDMIRVTNSDLFLYAGGESDVWVEELLAGADDAVCARSLLDWVDPLEEETSEGMQVKEHHHGPGEEEHAHEGVHLDEEEYDEHVWTSPVNAMLLVERIRDELIGLDPEREQIFRENADRYLEQLRRLDEDYRQLTEQAERKELVFGDRFPFLYLVHTYGLEYYAAFPGCSSETEPSAATIAFLTDKVREDQIPLVLQLELSNGRIADAVAEATGSRTAVLHSCHTLTRQEEERGETYLSLMRRNLEVLDEALNESSAE